MNGRRIFLAFPVPESIRVFAADVRDELSAWGIAGKPVPRENLHLTTLFLDRREARDLRKIREIGATVCARTPAFEMTCIGIGSFRSPPNLLHLALASEPPRAFAELSLALSREFSANGIPIHEKILARTPFPHLTLHRFRNRTEARGILRFGSLRRRLWHWNVPFPRPPTQPFAASCLHVVESTLTPRGPVYDSLAKLPLAPAELPAFWRFPK